MKRILILALLCGVAAAKPAAKQVTKAASPAPAEPAFVCSNAVYYLHEAALVGDTGVIAARLKEGKNPNEFDELGRSPLMIAAAAGQAAAVKALLAGGADVSMTDKQGKTPTQLSASPAVKKLLVAAEAVRAKEVELSKAIAAGDTAAVEKALAAGVNPNAMAADPNQGTLLMQAVMLGKTDIARMLLDRGAKVNVSNADGKSVLHVAAGSGAAELIPALLAAGADPKVQGPNGATPLHDAIWSNRLNAVQALLPAYKDCNFNPDGGWQGAAPAMAAGRGDGMLMAFVEAGIDPNAALNKNGETFLMVCARNNAGVDVMKALMAKGADPDLKDSEGKSAKDYANDNTKPLLTK